MKRKKENKRVDYIKTDIADVLKEGYLTYATSALVRMLPSAIDGLKPVQRRILFTMKNMKADTLTKCADIVGRTMQYAPHGDASIYAALVVMAQEGRVRNNLLVPQGNFGYITDSLSEYAAYRYTEACLSEYVKDFYFTEDFDFTIKMLTYKGIPEETEPVVLPALLPMILVQGGKGITPGFASSVIPHSLSGVAKAYIKFIEDREKPGKWKKMEDYIYANITPDFPRPCKIIRETNTGLQTGTGQILVEGKYRSSIGSRGRNIIQIYQLPHLVEIPRFVKQAHDVLKKKDLLAGISDESSRDGVLINIILKKGVSINEAMDLIKLNTPYRNSYNYSFVLNQDNSPKRMNALDIFEYHYRYKISTLNKYFEDKKNKLDYRKSCLSGAIYILGDQKRRSDFIKLLETSTKSNIIKSLKLKYDLEPHVSEFLINRRFSDLINKIEDMTKKLKEVEQEYEEVVKNLSNIDKYLIKQIKQKVKKYVPDFK